MPRFYFASVNANKTSCGPQTVTYSTFHHNTNKPVAHVSYKYCDAKIISETADTIKDCYGGHKMPFVTSVTLKPTDSTYSYYIDSTEDIQTWTKGSTIPSKAYIPSSGTLTYNAMHDSNLSTCQLPNLVRFTNNSIKYRLHNAIDDNTILNVTDPEHSFKDTCKWKNYPMASDSLTYYWQFNDPSGTNCISTASNKNWDCNYSVLAAPYHYFRGKYGPPPSGVQVVNMKVTDAVTRCSDSTSILLKQGPPDASWNKAAYCKMTWEMQETELTPKGSPGPNGPPLIGFMLNNQLNACTGASYPFKIDLSQTIPTAGASHWWIVFDSANAVRYKHCSNANDSTLDFGFTGDPSLGYTPGVNGYPAGGPDAFWNNIPWQGNYWYNNGDSGCKTIGIVLQNGTCYDTAWYHDYICFNKLDANFRIYNILPFSGAVKSKTLVDSSESQHGHICQAAPTINWTPLTSGGTYDFSSNKPYINEGLRINLYPKDTNQTDITAFQYNIIRNSYGDNPSYTNNGGQWYYSMPHNGVSGFWPDSATLNPFSTENDSVAQVKFHVNYIDTPHLYIVIPSTSATAGLPPKRELFNFPVYGTDTSGELDSLITRGHVNIPLSDSRARRISAICGKPYVTIYADPGFKVLSHTQILRLGGPKAVDSFITPGQVPQLSIPYPGFYTINSQSRNLEGCEQSATYYLVYGHYATFWVDDSIICLGQPTTIHWYVRYWSTNCPLPPGGGPPPPGCLNGADEQVGISNTIDFAPWDYTGASGGPTAYRDTLTNNKFASSMPAGYQPEQIWFNFGIPGDTLFHRILVKGNSYRMPTYIEPGVYTITMKTVDWRGCNVFTQRRNMMSVIQVKSKFSLERPGDTLTYCPPRIVAFYDSSTITGNKYTDKFFNNGRIIDSTVAMDTIEYQIWATGFGKPVTRLGTMTQYLADYPVADTFGVRLTVNSSISGCTSTIYKPHLLKIIGPAPKFAILGSSDGCYPFTVHVRTISHDKSVKIHTWNFGDPVKLNNPVDLPEDVNLQTATTTPPADSLTTLVYNRYPEGGRYRLYLNETDTFKDLSGNTISCTTSYPLPTDSNQQFVTVYPNSPIKIKANGLLINSATDTFKAISGYGEYRNYSWSFGNGTTKTDSDSAATVTYSAADVHAASKDSKGRAIFMVRVTATSKDGCTITDSFTVLDGYANIEETLSGLEDFNVYPNPFYDKATIEYSLVKKSKVSLEILDVTGKQLGYLNQQNQPAGKYQFDINADQYHLTPGVYILKVTLDNGFAIRHIVKL